MLVLKWLFASRALDARHSIEKLRHQKSMQETLDEDYETRSSDDSLLKDGSNSNGSTEETMTCNQKTFQIGEFVYIEGKKDVSVMRVNSNWSLRSTLKFSGLWSARGQNRASLREERTADAVR